MCFQTLPYLTLILSVLFLYFLSTPAQNVADIKKLKSAGICTVKVCSTLKCLSNERVCVTHVFLHIVLRECK